MPVAARRGRGPSGVSGAKRMGSNGTTATTKTSNAAKNDHLVITPARVANHRPTPPTPAMTSDGTDSPTARYPAAI